MKKYFNDTLVKYFKQLILVRTISSIFLRPKINFYDAYIETYIICLPKLLIVLVMHHKPYVKIMQIIPSVTIRDLANTVASSYSVCKQGKYCKLQYLPYVDLKILHGLVDVVSKPKSRLLNVAIQFQQTQTGCGSAHVI